MTSQVSRGHDLSRKGIRKYDRHTLRRAEPLKSLVDDPAVPEAEGSATNLKTLVYALLFFSIKRL